jgi:hypothetical protein
MIFHWRRYAARAFGIKAPQRCRRFDGPIANSYGQIRGIEISVAIFQPPMPRTLHDGNTLLHATGIAVASR